MAAKNGTTPQEQQTEAQQPEANGCNDGKTPQEQQMEAQQPEGNEGQMYLFSDDESDNIEDESKEDTVKTEQNHSKQIFISIWCMIEIAEAAIWGRTALALPSVVWHGKATCRAIKLNVISNHCQN